MVSTRSSRDLSFLPFHAFAVDVWLGLIDACAPRTVTQWSARMKKIFSQSAYKADHHNVSYHDHSMNKSQKIDFRLRLVSSIFRS
jgi:hypothetical protein